MRLIDADALIADLEHDVAIDQDTLDYEDLTEINRINIQFDKDCKQNAIDLLKNAPTIEPERKKGRWEAKSFHEVFCNKCGFDFDIMTNDFFDKMYFCPNCGSYNGGEEE